MLARPSRSFGAQPAKPVRRCSVTKLRCSASVVVALVPPISPTTWPSRYGLVVITFESVLRAW